MQGTAVATETGVTTTVGNFINAPQFPAILTGLCRSPYGDSCSPISDCRVHIGDYILGRIWRILHNVPKRVYVAGSSANQLKG